MDVKRFMDEDGVVHWQYVMRGILTLCGMYPLGDLVAPTARETAAPTCLRCIAAKEAYDPPCDDP